MAVAAIVADLEGFSSKPCLITVAADLQMSWSMLVKDGIPTDL